MRQPGSLCVEKIVWVGFKLAATLYRLDLNWLPCSDIILDNSSRDKIAMGQEPPCYSLIIRGPIMWIQQLLFYMTTLLHH